VEGKRITGDIYIYICIILASGVAICGYWNVGVGTQRENGRAYQVSRGK
jgi:hypothetical protein